jgi:hypothetical protein
MWWGQTGLAKQRLRTTASTGEQHFTSIVQQSACQTLSQPPELSRWLPTPDNFARQRSRRR